MKTIMALIIKLLMITAVLWIILGLYGVSFINILLTSVLLTGVSFIGDMLIVPRVGNLAATIVDFGTSLVIIWLVGTYFSNPPIGFGMATFISAIFVTAGEFLFHIYLQKQLFTDPKPVPKKVPGSYQKNNMQTEFGSVADIRRPTDVKLASNNPEHRPKKRKKKNPY